MPLSDTRMLVTGANGFIRKNLLVRLNELSNVTVSTFVRGGDAAILPKLVAEVDAIIHLAGENRPPDESAFLQVNTGLTAELCNAIKQEFRNAGRHVPLVLASSTQAECDNPYGRSKLAAETAVQNLAKETGNPCAIFRLPGVFGKWCKPNYNSVVATFCHNISNDLPIKINDPFAAINLVYVDDVVSDFIRVLDAMPAGMTRGEVSPVYSTTLGDLAKQIEAFKNCRESLVSERVGLGLVRALYATYVSYLPPTKFVYDLPKYGDERGMFVEMLKTKDTGQFSYFTAHPGVTRGGHYHHTKTEKFLVIKGSARFRFRHVMTNERYEINTSGDKPQIVETVPGWTHDITNIGQDEMVVMLWANEIFDRAMPDTIAAKV